jgi:hypothetical protein
LGEPLEWSAQLAEFACDGRVDQPFLLVVGGEVQREHRRDSGAGGRPLPHLAIILPFPIRLPVVVVRKGLVEQVEQARLQIAIGGAGVSEDLRRKAEESMAAADAALKGADGPAGGKGPLGTGKRVRPQ